MTNRCGAFNRSPITYPGGVTVSYTYRPKRPGGYLFVRIDPSGQIVDWPPGL